MTGLVAPLAVAAQQQVAVSDSDYKDLVFWGAILVVSMLVLFVAQKAIRFGVQSKIRSIHREFAIRPDDLDRMAKSGFLSDEERKRINEAIVRNLSKEAREAVRSHSAEKLPAEVALKAELEKTKQTAPRLAPTSAKPAATLPDTPPTGQAPKSFDQSLAPPDPSPSESAQPEPRTVDLERLLERGMITTEEYERLRSGQTDEVV